VPTVAVEKTPAGDAYAAELKKRQDALETLFAKKRDQLLDRLRTQTPMYLAAVTEIEKLHTEEFYSFIQPDDVNPVVARRWHLYLLETKKTFHPVFAAWTTASMISLPTYATKGGSAAATMVKTASTTTPPGADRHTSPSARAECWALALRRTRNAGSAERARGRGG
jgi:hypothetical protein